MATVFVDDMNFYTSGVKFQENMQEILDTYSELYQATRGRIQYEKTMSYCWQWEWTNNKKEIRDIELNVKIGKISITQQSIKQQSKMLGVYMSPTLR